MGKLRELKQCIAVGILTSSLGPVFPSRITSSYYINFDIGGVCTVPTIVEDWQWVIMTIIHEAAFESLKGKTMVAEVIRDRAETKYNSDGTIVDTVLRAFQFSGWNTEDRNRIKTAKLDLSTDVVSDAIRAYNLAFKGRTNYAMGANLYHADYMNPYPGWTLDPKVTRLTQEGHHIFYFEAR